MVAHTLYIVGTPIGNLEDINTHALRVLREVSLIAAENPTRTLRLLSRYEIEKPLIRFTDAYERKKAERLRAVLDGLERGDVAFVSEAGMPLLADPGYELVQAAIERGIRVVPIPGPAALPAALSVSGLPAVPSTFLGFPSRKPGARRALLRPFAGDPRTLVLYESPNRLLDTLVDVQAELGDRCVAVACELTKLYEETWRGRVGDAISHFRVHAPRGEYVIVIGGAEEGQDDRVG